MWGMLVAAALVTAPPTPSQVSAERLANEAEAAYVDGDLPQAATLAREAYALDPRAEFLFMWAQSEREADRCERALPLFREFMTHGGEFKPEDRPQVMARASEAIAACEDKVEPEDEVVDPLLVVEPAPEPETQGVEPTPPPPRPPRERNSSVKPAPDTRSRNVDPLGTSLVAIGGSVLIAGGVLGSTALYDRRNAPSAGTEGGYARQVEREPALRWTGIGMMTVGTAVLVGGIVRLVILRRTRPDVARRFAPRTGPSTWRGNF